MSTSIGRSNTIRGPAAKGITAPLNRRDYASVVALRELARSASLRPSNVLQRSNNEPEIVPDLTLSLSLWQRLEWASRVRRRQQQTMMFDENPLQLELDLESPIP